MCYSNCRYEYWNPISGTCICRLPKNKTCPDTDEHSQYCEICDKKLADNEANICDECYYKN